MTLSFLTDEELLRHTLAQGNLTPLETELALRLENAIDQADDEMMYLDAEVKQLEDEMEALQERVHDQEQEGHGLDAGG